MYVEPKEQTMLESVSELDFMRQEKIFPSPAD